MDHCVNPLELALHAACKVMSVQENIMFVNDDRLLHWHLVDVYAQLCPQPRGDHNLQATSGNVIYPIGKAPCGKVDQTWWNWPG